MRGRKPRPLSLAPGDLIGIAQEIAHGRDNIGIRARQRAWRILYAGETNEKTQIQRA